MNEYTQCWECGALVYEFDGMPDKEHRKWHSKINDRLGKLEDRINTLLIAVQQSSAV